MSLRSRTARAIVKMSPIVVPFASARIAAAWITGPSAIGSENGTPSSIASAPASASARMMSAVGPSPHVTYPIRPRRPSSRRRRKSCLTRFKRGHLRHVFVAAPAQIRHHDFAPPEIVTQQPPERVRRLERGDDPLALAQFVERLEREVVAAVVVLDAADRLEIGMLRPDRRIVEPR